ncbi:unnamed protein product [Plutella xylostella]|uniref:(diamondback moth) hypothetical protein n=1 Tax=Plutella xylostella TaxID=51655 RepID=A0A8S4DVY5_PLUXY|nr:unnamed protein product [Plutella xylostella]
MSIFFLLLAVCFVNGVKYDGLRVKFGWSDALANKEYFFKLPRTALEAEGLEWTRTERPPGPLPELRMYCQQGRAVCPLYDAAGFVAGLQLALPVENFESLAIKPEKKFTKWSTPGTLGDPARDYWTTTQYFVSEESMKAGAGPQLENGETLQDGAVWVKGQDGVLLRVPSTEQELNTTAFKKQNCIPNMGTHYYYNMTPQMKCEDFLPWFALVSRGDLVGTGFQMFGKLTKPPAKLTDWFERPPSPKKSAEITIPLAPPCLGEWAQSYGVVSLHIYYIDEPWKIKCETGDSIRPAPALDRFMLNGYRYASQVADEFKKLFSG